LKSRGDRTTVIPLVPKLQLGNAPAQKLRFTIPIEDDLIATRRLEKKTGKDRDRSGVAKQSLASSVFPSWSLGTRRKQFEE